MPSNDISNERLREAYQIALARYGSRENVTAIDIGYKYTDGKRTDQIVIRIHVREKIAESALEAAELIPEEISGVPTDVIQAVYEAQRVEPATCARRQRNQVLTPGISVSHPTVTAGTLGLIVYDRDPPHAAYMLSNWHVLAGSSQATPGDPIIQPGSADGGSDPQDTVATLSRMLLNMHGDAAIARFNGARQLAAHQCDSSALVKDVRDPVIGEELEKSGRTTGVTRGKVDGIGRYSIRYSVGVVGIDGFKIVPVIDGNPNNEEISKGGDSGSVWYSVTDNHGVGLHFAGETATAPTAEHAVACFLATVLDELDVVLSRRILPEPPRIYKDPGDFRLIDPGPLQLWLALVMWAGKNHKAVDELRSAFRAYASLHQTVSESLEPEEDTEPRSLDIDIPGTDLFVRIAGLPNIPPEPPASPDEPAPREEGGSISIGLRL